MKLKKMNEALQSLRAKYAVKADGELIKSPASFCGAGAMLRLADGSIVKLLPWRKERRFVELKKLAEGGTLEDVSTLRFAYFSGKKSLKQELYRELDLAAYLGNAKIKSLFTTRNGETANVVLRLADGKSCCIECSAILPENTEDMDRHEIIARRGVASDRVVDTQVPQASIYKFTAEGEERFTDTDTELFGFELEEILLIRAAFAVLSDKKLAKEWNKADALLAKQVEDALDSDASGKPVSYK